MRLTTILLFVGACVLQSACSEQPLRVGSKAFSEQKILGEMIAEMAGNAGIPVLRGIGYGGTAVVFEGIKQGKIDVYPAYTGTALGLLGQPASQDADQAYQRVSRLFKPLGLAWHPRFGFSNNYVLVMRPGQAGELNVKTISDLAKVSGGIRFVSPPEFLTRPRDGMDPLLRRYGLTQAGPPIVAEENEPRYAALLAGKADVAIGFSTDGQIAAYDLRVLEDDANFFPVYQPAPLVRDDALQRFPALGNALARLGNTIDEQTMRELNKAVDLDGKDYRTVAHNFLVSHQLIAGTKKGTGTEPLRVAIEPLQSDSEYARNALRATRESFRGRSVELLTTPMPIQALAQGKARMAVTGAEAFFRLDGAQPEPTDAAVAVARIGFRYAHVLAASASGPSDLADMRSLAVPVADGPSARAVDLMLAGLDLQSRIALKTPKEPTLAAAAQIVRDGDADGLIMMAPAGSSGIGALMRSGDFRLVPVTQWNKGNNLAKFPFLSIVTLPANSYANMPQPVQTLGAQAVLAGPAPTREVVGDAGPATGAPPDRPNPIAAAEVKQINAELADKTSIDPSLPRAAGLTPALPDLNSSINPSAAVSVTNLIVILVIIYLFYLFAREGRQHQR